MGERRSGSDRRVVGRTDLQIRRAVDGRMETAEGLVEKVRATGVIAQWCQVSRPDPRHITTRFDAYTSFNRRDPTRNTRARTAIESYTDGKFVGNSIRTRHRDCVWCTRVTYGKDEQ